MYGLQSSVEYGYTDENTNARVGDQNLHGLQPSVRNLFVESNANTRVGDQNLYGPGPCVRNSYESSGLRSLPMPLGNNETITNPYESSVTTTSHDIIYQGQVDGQNLYGRQSPLMESNTEHLIAIL